MKNNDTLPNRCLNLRKQLQTFGLPDNQIVNLINSFFDENESLKDEKNIDYLFSRIVSQLDPSALSENQKTLQKINQFILQDYIRKTLNSLGNTMHNSEKLHPLSLKFLLHGAPEGEWNQSLFKTSLDMCRHGVSLETVENQVEKINGYLTATDKKTIKSAFKAVTSERDE